MLAQGKRAKRRHTSGGDVARGVRVVDVAGNATQEGGTHGRDGGRQLREAYPLGVGKDVLEGVVDLGEGEHELVAVGEGGVRAEGLAHEVDDEGLVVGEPARLDGRQGVEAPASLARESALDLLDAEAELGQGVSVTEKGAVEGIAGAVGVERGTNLGRGDGGGRVHEHERESGDALGPLVIPVEVEGPSLECVVHMTSSRRVPTPTFSHGIPRGGCRIATTPPVYAEEGCFGGMNGQ